MSNLETKRKDRFRAARPPSLAKLPIKMAVAVMALIALPLAAYMVYDAYRYFKQEAAEIENSILQEKKIISRITVEDILSDIYYRRFQAEQRFKRTLRDDVEKDIQQEVLLRIQKFHSGRGNTLIIFDSNGSVIADAALFPDDVRAFVETVDDSGRKLVEKAMNQAHADKEGTYLRYVQTDAHTGESLPKISYAREFNAWGWTVVSEARLTQIDDATAEQEHQLVSDVIKKLAFLGFMILLGSVMTLLVGRFYSFKLRLDFNAFSTFFGRSDSSRHTVDTTRITFSEFIDFGVHANRMINESSRKNDQLQTQAQELRRLYSAVEQAPVSVVVTDKSGRDEDVNPKFTEVTQIPCRRLPVKTLAFSSPATSPPRCTRSCGKPLQRAEYGPVSC